MGQKFYSFIPVKICFEFALTQDFPLLCMLI
nr:MAG TPA: hypothetical protein [Caudoviricetes sp.]